MKTDPDPSPELDRLVDSFLDRQRRGERPTMQEYIERHPELAGQIREVFPALELLEEFAPGVTTGHPSAPVAESPPARLGEFRILREVGRGGMGVVYEAVQESLGRHVALKVLPTQARANAAYLERFRREAQSAARLHHSGIVPVFSVGEHEGVCYYAMQYIAGQTLANVLQEIGRVRDSHQAIGPRPGTLAHSLLTAAAGADASTLAASAAGPGSLPSTSATDLEGGAARREVYFRNVARIGALVAEALAYAHAQGVVHRDVKPANLMLDLEGGVWLTDFGLAKLEGSDDLTRTGDLLGTLRYAAPEQLLGKGEARSDVYSLGVTLYEMATLRPAFDDPVKARLLDRILKEDVTAPGKLEPQLPKDLETIILKATAKEPGRRYQSAADLAEDLRRFLADRPVKARRASRLEHAWRWCRRNRGVALLGAGLVALIGGVIPALLLAHSMRLGAKLQEVAEARGDEEVAKLDALDKLAISYLEQARAKRMSRQVGHRFDTLDAIEKSARHTRELGLSGERLRERLDDLRTEAIAALALPDLQVMHERTFPPREGFAHISERFDVYAIPTRDGGPREGISIQRVSDGEEVSFLEGNRHHAYYKFSPDSRFLAAAVPPQLSVWEVGRPKPVRTLPLAGQAYAFSPDGRTLAVGHPAGRIDCFDLATWKIAKTLPTGAAPFYLTYHPQGKKLAAVFGTTVRVLDLDTGATAAELGHPVAVFRAAWHPSGKWLATSDDASDFRTWDVSGQRQLLHIKGGQVQGFGVGLCYNATGECLFTNGFDGRMWVWDAVTGRPVLSALNEAYLHAHPRDNLVGPCTTFTSIAVWRLEPATVYRPLAHHNYALGRNTATLAIHPGGRLVAVGGDHELDLFDLAAGVKVGHLPLRTPTPAFDPAGNLLVASADGLYRWPVEAEAGGATRLRLGKPVLELARPADHADFSRDGQVVALSDGLTLFVYRGGDPDRGFHLGNFTDVANPALSPHDGRWLAARVHAPPMAIRVWDLANKRVVKEVPLRGHLRGTAQFSPDGRWLSIGAGVHRMIRTASWEEGPPRGPARFEAGTFSHDGRLVAVERGDGVVSLSDVETGREHARLTDPNGHQAHAMAFTPDGAKLVTVNKAHFAVHVWDLRLLRAELARLGLDWEAPAYTPAEAGAEGPLEVKTDLGTLHSLYGERFAREGKWPEAVSAWKKSLEADPNQAEVHRRIAEVLLHRSPRDSAAALTHAERAVALSPRPDTFFVRGDVRYVLKEYRQAREDFAACLEQDAAHTEAWHLRAHCHEYLGDVRAALRDIDKALALKPADVHFHEMKAGYHFRLKEHLPMLAAAERAAALQKQPGAQTVTLLGLAHSRLGNHARAVPHLVRAAELTRDGPSGTVFLALAISQHHVGEAGKARANYQKALTWRKAHPKLTAEQAARYDELRAEAEKALGVKTGS